MEQFFWKGNNNEEINFAQSENGFQFFFLLSIDKEKWKKLRKDNL